MKFCSLFVATLLGAASAFAASPVKISSNLTTLGPGDSFIITLKGTPGDYAVLMSSPTLGPTALPPFGNIDIGTPFPGLFMIVGPFGPNGELNQVCDLPCVKSVPAVVNAHYQAIQVDGTKPWLPLASLSNVLSITYDPGLFRDCNGNGIHDGCDIRDGYSADANQDGVPDECLDCNADGSPDGPNIAGCVWQDLDNDGVQDVDDPGIEGVVVTAFDGNGAVVGGAVTDDKGCYTLVGVANPAGVRVEFTEIPSWLTISPNATGAGRDVQFVINQSCATDLALIAPSELCPEGTQACLATPCYVNGDPVAGGSAGSLDAIVRFPYGATGSGSNGYLASAKNIGSVWGMAYSRGSDTLFTAAFLKRHVGFGPGGLDAIYAIDDACFGAAGQNAVSVWLNVGTLPGVNVGAVSRLDLPASFSLPSYDADAYAKVGTVGLGGIAMAEDERTLYVVNLFQREVLEIDVATKTLTKQYPVDSGMACVGGVARPFAIQFYRGELYVGVTCTGETNPQNNVLEARVRRLVNGVFTDVLSVPLNYPRGQAYVVCPLTGWFPWVSTFFPTCGAGVAIFPQPILSDLAFDRDGCLTLGFIDRFGHQTGFQNFALTGTSLWEGFSGGDMLRACLVGGNYQLENNASAGGVTTTGSGNSQGPGGGEFYRGDSWSVAGNVAHHEVTLGGLAQLPGSGEVATTTFDPISGAPTEIRTGGVRFFSTATGETADAYKIYETTTPGTFGKAAGLGDLSLMCSPLAIVLGDRVFQDNDGDGAQDAGEAGIAGVRVDLYRGGAFVTSTTSSSAGEFTFTGLLANDDTYEVRIDLNQSALNNLIPTQLNAGQDDLADSDGDSTLVAGSVVAKVKTGGPGRNDFTVDFGFKGP